MKEGEQRYDDKGAIANGQDGIGPENGSLSTAAPMYDIQTDDDDRAIGGRGTTRSMASRAGGRTEEEAVHEEDRVRWLLSRCPLLPSVTQYAFLCSCAYETSPFRFSAERF